MKKFPNKNKKLIFFHLIRNFKKLYLILEDKNNDKFLIYIQKYF
jgi:hypothetical protein